MILEQLPEEGSAKILLPQLSKTQKVVWGILCALEVNQEPEFVEWANGWLEGTEKNRWPARTAWPAWEAVVEERSARVGAAWAAMAAEASRAAALEAARFARVAARARVVAGGKPIDFIALAEKAMAMKHVQRRSR